MVAKKRVFISYSWVPIEFKAAVWELAGWLERASNGEIEVITDHLFSVKPPAEGWQRWMANEEYKADIVLSICTPMYKLCFEGNTDIDEKGGFGVTHEGLIITARFYEEKGSNSKYFPVLPDNGNIDDIPVILRPYDNGLKFPSGNQRIFDLILGENPSHPGRRAQSENVSKAMEETEHAIQLEKEIVNEIAKSMGAPSDNMNFDLQILIRSYLALSDAEKNEVINSIDKELNLPANDPDEKDKLFIMHVNNKRLLTELWQAINNINPFENPVNPYC